jgi:hypothetical protein
VGGPGTVTGKGNPESRDLLTRLDRLQEAQQAAARWRTVAFALATLSVGLALWLVLRG